uniref:Uncharacterized protein n=1 Tax=Anguilla anguilla TaxID=7936 RepID=A0A0E9TK02_ANGAN
MAPLQLANGWLVGCPDKELASSPELP